MARTLYKVQSGESLSKIARDIMGDMERWPEIAYINGLQHPYIIMPGQILELPDDDAEPIDILVTGYADEQAAPPVKQAEVSTRPATVLALLAVGAAFLLLRK